MRETLRRGARVWLPPVVTGSGLATGLILHAAGRGQAGDWAWGAVAAGVLVWITLSVIRSLVRRRPGVDLIALLAIAGALALGEYLAGAVVAAMLTGGQALEAFAGSRARRELTGLLERAPRMAHRYEDGALASRHVGEIVVGDLMLVAPGGVVPVDGLVVTAAAVLDESALTGEARPVERVSGEPVRSGSVNAGGPFDLRATASAEESTYAGIVRLVAEAQETKSPFVRMADRYAVVFTPLAIGIAALAWALSGDAVRALAVLVVATPCPLILAAPVAVVCGISRAARRGIVVKGGQALEGLAQARRVVMDKTGTLTAGSAVVNAVEAESPAEATELLRLAASLDQVSAHVFSAAIVRAALQRGLVLSFPTGVVEHPGTGIEGLVDGRRVRVGGGPWVLPGGEPERLQRLRRQVMAEGHSSVFVSAEGSGTAMIVVEDPLRADTPRTIRALRRAGVQELVILTGDQADIAAIVGESVGADRVLAERSPAEKVEAVRAQHGPGTTVMVGDGINDAAALAAADVGVALGARGAAAHSEAADVVIVVDHLDRLVEAMTIARRSYRIARQSVVAGMGLSAAAMVAAALGALPPVAGALLQEAIDVAVILNALRALSPGRRPATDTEGPAVAQHFRLEHRKIVPELECLHRLADVLDTLPPPEALRELGEVRTFLTERLVPHEAEDDRILYPVVAGILGGDDPTGAMSRGHQEIQHLIRRYASTVDELPATGPDVDDLRTLRSLLYGLDAVLRLHFAQEEESYLTLSALEFPPARALGASN
ncbi:MAG: copper-exporting ATPase [Actinobacteria bacterium]|nr:copper-exporting ATPase [Actinomycetota bacterium]